MSVFRHEKNYENVHRYFLYRKIGLSKQKAIANANRVKCSDESHPEVDEAKYKARKHVQDCLEAKMSEVLLQAKKEHLGNIYTYYLERPKEDEISNNASRIYKEQVNEINNQIAKTRIENLRRFSESKIKSQTAVPEKIKSARYRAKIPIITLNMSAIRIKEVMRRINQNSKNDPKMGLKSSFSRSEAANIIKRTSSKESFY